MDKKIVKAVLEASEEVLGLPADEMAESMDLNLIENSLIDSVGCAALVTTLNDILGKHISIDKMEPEDFASLNAIAAAIERTTKK